MRFEYILCEICVVFKKERNMVRLSSVSPNVSIRETLDKIRYTVRRNSKFVVLNF